MSFESVRCETHLGGYGQLPASNALLLARNRVREPPLPTSIVKDHASSKLLNELGSMSVEVITAEFRDQLSR